MNNRKVYVAHETSATHLGDAIPLMPLNLISYVRAMIPAYKAYMPVVWSESSRRNKELMDIVNVTHQALLRMFNQASSRPNLSADEQRRVAKEHKVMRAGFHEALSAFSARCADYGMTSYAIGEKDRNSLAQDIQRYKVLFDDIYDHLLDSIEMGSDGLFIDKPKRESAIRPPAFESSTPAPIRVVRDGDLLTQKSSSAGRYSHSASAGLSGDAYGHEVAKKYYEQSHPGQVYRTEERGTLKKQASKSIPNIATPARKESFPKSSPPSSDRTASSPESSGGLHLDDLAETLTHSRSKAASSKHRNRVYSDDSSPPSSDRNASRTRPPSAPPSRSLSGSGSERQFSERDLPEQRGQPSRKTHPQQTRVKLADLKGLESGACADALYPFPAIKPKPGRK